jgi:hypothetical protein
MPFQQLHTASYWLSKPFLCQRQIRPHKWTGSAVLFLCLAAAAIGAAVVDCWLQWSDPKNAMVPLQPKLIILRQQKEVMAKANGMFNKIQQNCSIRLEGTTALDFTLPNAFTGQKVHLGDLLRKKPVVLLFGSFG